MFSKRFYCGSNFSMTNDEWFETNKTHKNCEDEESSSLYEKKKKSFLKKLNLIF